MTQVAPDPRAKGLDAGAKPQSVISAAAYDSVRAAREARLLTKRGTPRMTKEARLAKMRANAEVGRQVIKEKLARRKLVEEKVRLGMPITDEERDLLSYKSNASGPSRLEREKQTLAAASQLLLRPTNVNDLRALIEKTAAKYHYNPVEALIKMLQPEETEVAGVKTVKYQVPAVDRIGIHKTLLPFLAPQLKVAPAREADPEKAGVKVTVTMFEFPEERASARPVHEKANPQKSNTSITGTTTDLTATTGTPTFTS